MRVIFAGTPEFSVPPLLSLIHSEEHDVVAVFTQPDRVSGRGKKITPPAVKVTALEHALPVFQPESLTAQHEIIQDLEPDVMVVVAYGMLLPQRILDIPSHGCINIHASLLPRWRGAAPIQRAIEAGDQITGVSIMQMESGLDTGPVYQMIETQINDQDTSADLHDRLSTLGAEGLISTLSQLSNLGSVEQDHDKSCYAKKITKAEATIDWHQACHEIQQRIRAFIPWPICQTHHKKTRIRVWGSRDVSNLYLTAQSKHAAAGEVVGQSSEGIDVACGEGVLRLTHLQRDGAKVMPAVEFCNGYTLKAGDHFGQG